MRILVTGGAGFVGSHVAETFCRDGHDVVVYDNLSRAEMLGANGLPVNYNWAYLAENYGRDVNLVRGDILNFDALVDVVSKSDVIVHAAAQTAVTTSVQDPRTDFENNGLGTFNVLEAARLSPKQPTVVFCSTNKVYGKNVNSIETEQRGSRYTFKNGTSGISEDLSIDLCEHTPYGCSKLAGDVYCQDYGSLYGLRVGIFRMSCIYGTRQLGVEDQGWVAWFTIASVAGKRVTIFGDGKQVRDVLHVSDLVSAFERFIKDESLQCEVFNIGGGTENTTSLVELLEALRTLTGSPLAVEFDDWRPSDQKVYVSDISKLATKLGWRPRVALADGLADLHEWVRANQRVLA